MNNQNNELEFKKIKIDDMYKVAAYLFIVLSNGQKVLTNGKELYDVSEYSGLMDLFFMEEKLCAVLKKEFSKCVVELKTMEVLFEDKEVSYVIKKDDRTLYIMKKIGKGNDKIYNIKEKNIYPYQLIMNLNKH